jgi:hypothetical protein
VEDCIIERFLLPRKTSTIVAPGGGGKSTLAVDLALHVALGWPWFGNVTHQRDVAFVSCEGSDDTGRRAIAWCRERGAATPTNLFWFDEGVQLNVKGNAEKLVAQLKACGFKRGGLMIIDSVTSTAPGSDQSSQREIAPLMTTAIWIAQQLEAHVMLLHHPTKHGDQTEGKGAVDITNLVDLTIAIEGRSSAVAGDHYVVGTLHKHRSYAMPPAAYTLKLVDIGVRTESGQVYEFPVVQPIAMPKDSEDGVETRAPRETIGDVMVNILKEAPDQRMTYENMVKEVQKRRYEDTKQGRTQAVDAVRRALERKTVIKQEGAFLLL